LPKDVRKWPNLALARPICASAVPKPVNTNLVDFTTDETTLDQFSVLDSDSEDDFEPSMLSNEGDCVATTPVAVSQPGGISDLVDVDWISMTGLNVSNEHLILLL